MLSFIFFFLILSITVLFFLNDAKYLRFCSLLFSSITFIYSVKLLLLFDCSNYYFQNIIRYSLNFESLNLQLSFGLDGISLFFFILSSFLIFLCVLFVFDEKHLKYYLLNLFILELLLLLVFSVLDILLFYIFFEAILIPMYLVIGVWGSRERKNWAAYMLFFYTLCGSLLLLLGILYIYKITGTFNIEFLLSYNFTDTEQFFLWLAFFLSFASKIPMFPLHIWLPEAHVEAPTVGSVLLAGILLKLGVYGFIRFSLPLFPVASLYFTPIIHTLCAIGVVYASLAAVRQTDLKRIIAYSSVAHMNLIVIGIFSFNYLGVEGALLQSISHGFVSAALFFIVGMVYARYHTRSIYYYSGMVQIMPICSSFFLIFTMANIALPGTSSFVGEFLILMGIFKINFRIALIVVVSVVLCGSYSLWIYNRFAFGNLKHLYILKYSDLNFREFSILLPLLIFTLIMGFIPYIYFQFVHSSVIFVLINSFI
jgi:proton-translocating NADH-quinone oxidoreductase chain M